MTDAPPSEMATEISRRRTFAIISHPDAGKTTLTERLLRLGGAIQLAGNVRAKREQRKTRSDWMSIERERGISVVTSVMTFEHAGCVFNLLDTPGHEDFSEDTYRTLTAVDSAVMVIDAAKGIEARTKKLFEICRMRDIPIITFVNKMDRESQDVFALLDEVSSTLALDTAPVTWPVGRAADFVGTYDLRRREYRLTRELAQSDPRFAALDEEMELVRAALPEFEVAPFMEGHLTPVYFGSAMKEIGVADLLQGLAEYGPRPRAQAADTRVVEATEANLTALVFKIQANMDPNHRDRIAFARVCSGRLARGMRLKQVRTGKLIPLHAPQFFFARDRALAEEAFAGDVVGIPNHGTLRIGDTLSEFGGSEFRRRALFRARNPAPGAAGRRHEGQKTAPGAAGTGRGRGGAAVPPAGRQPANGGRGGHAAARRAAGAAGGRVRGENRLRDAALPACPLAVRRAPVGGTVCRRPAQRHGRRRGRRSGVPGQLGLYAAAYRRS